METKKNQKKRPAAAAKKKPQQQPPRRQPGANAKRNQPQKAPHAQPRKHAPVKEQPIRVTPEVVYLPPKPFSRNRFILHLATVVAVVLALMLGLSVFFKVERIEVSGCEQYTAYQIQQASGVSEGDQLLAFSRAKAAGRIINQLPYVKSVRIGISLPDTVKIEIVETRVTYALEAFDGSWWLMNSDGKLIELATEETLGSSTKVSGVILDSPKAGEQAKAYQFTTAQTDAEGNAIPVTVTAAQRLDAVVEIATDLEKWGIIGEIASMDVEDLYNIELWYGEKYQVLLGNTDSMNQKIKYLKSIADDYAVTRPYDSGVLDISDPDWIEFQSFEE